MSSEILKENHLYLKACILYEVLQKKPIFDSYRNFCDTVGQDAISYPDFEFWFYRFHHGNRDFDYDRSADPEAKTIMDIPIESMIEIVRYLNPVERTRLRSLNHAIKDVSDSFPTDLESIQVVSDSRISWALNHKHFSCNKELSGCSLNKPNCPVEKTEKCHIKKGLEHLAPVLKLPNILVKHFSVELYGEILDRDDLLPVSFNAKNVYVAGQNPNQLVQFLSAMTAGHLESICIEMPFIGKREDNRIIFETDQFKQAKSVEREAAVPINVQDLVNFSHLQTFKCHLTSINSRIVQDVRRIRDIVSNFEKLESCELTVRSLWNRFRAGAFAEALGEEIPVGPRRRIIHHRYQVPGSNKCLVFKVVDEVFRCRIRIVRVR
ncbi:unnamed protein product [Caenorhabditis nigoni]